LKGLVSGGAVVRGLDDSDVQVRTDCERGNVGKREGCRRNGVPDGREAEVSDQEGAKIICGIGELTRRVHVGGRRLKIEEPHSNGGVSALAPVGVLVAEGERRARGDDAPANGRVYSSMVRGDYPREVGQSSGEGSEERDMINK